MQQEAMLAIADMRAEDPALPLGLCLFDETWHQGVVGLVASRVKDRVHRPVIALARADATTLKGSARSVTACTSATCSTRSRRVIPDLIEKFGGHAMAAGLTLRAAALDGISRGVRCRGASLDDASMTPSASCTPMARSAAASCTLDVARLLQSAGPWGQAFPEPLFDGCFQVRAARVVGERHLQAGSAGRRRRPVRSDRLPALRRRRTRRDVQPDARVELAYRLDVNQYNGLEKVQLVVEYLRVL